MPQTTANASHTPLHWPSAPTPGNPANPNLSLPMPVLPLRCSQTCLPQACRPPRQSAPADELCIVVNTCFWLSIGGSNPQWTHAQAGHGRMGEGGGGMISETLWLAGQKWHQN